LDNHWRPIVDNARLGDGAINKGRQILDRCSTYFVECGRLDEKGMLPPMM
jgi:hypothetical protein